MKPFLLLLLALLPASSQAEQLIRITAEDVIARLRQNGTLVCFERVHNQEADAITSQAQIEAIEKIPADQRTPRENERLKSNAELQKEDKAHSIVNWKQTQFTFDYPDAATEPKAILDALIKADPDYTWEQRGKRYLVYPKENSFNRPISEFTAENLKFWSFVRAANGQIFTPSKLNYVNVIMGRPWTTDYVDKTFSLKFGPSDTRTALTEFCNAIDENIVWHVIGCDPDWVNLSCFPVSKKE